MPMCDFLGFLVLLNNNIAFGSCVVAHSQRFVTEVLQIVSHKCSVLFCHGGEICSIWREDKKSTHLAVVLLLD